MVGFRGGLSKAAATFRVVARVVQAACRWRRVLRRMAAQRLQRQRRLRAVFVLQCWIRRRWQRRRLWAVNVAGRIAAGLKRRFAAALRSQKYAAPLFQRVGRAFAARRAVHALRQSLAWARVRDTLRRRCACFIARRELRSRARCRESQTLLLYGAVAATHALLRAERTAWRVLCAQWFGAGGVGPAYFVSAATAPPSAPKGKQEGGGGKTNAASGYSSNNNNKTAAGGSYRDDWRQRSHSILALPRQSVAAAAARFGVDVASFSRNASASGSGRGLQAFLLPPDVQAQLHSRLSLSASEPHGPPPKGLPLSPPQVVLQQLRHVAGQSPSSLSDSKEFPAELPGGSLKPPLADASAVTFVGEPLLLASPTSGKPAAQQQTAGPPPPLGDPLQRRGFSPSSGTGLNTSVNKKRQSRPIGQPESSSSLRNSIVYVALRGPGGKQSIVPAMLLDVSSPDEEGTGSRGRRGDSPDVPLSEATDVAGWIRTLLMPRQLNPLTPAAQRTSSQRPSVSTRERHSTSSSSFMMASSFEAVDALAELDASLLLEGAAAGVQQGNAAPLIQSPQRLVRRLQPDGAPAVAADGEGSSLSKRGSSAEESAAEPNQPADPFAFSLARQLFPWSATEFEASAVPNVVLMSQTRDPS